MNTSEEFWSAVDEELDARRDPLGNESVRTWVLAHPEDALELADMQASMREIERADNPLRRSRRMPIAAAAAGLLLLALGARIAFPSRSAAEDLKRHPAVAAPALGSVQSWEIVSTVQSADGTITVRASEGRLRLEQRTADVSSSVEGVVLSSESLVMR